MTIKQVYFIGIGGIGMSNLARYYRSRSLMVAGYDRTETELTRQLVKEGMEIHYRDAVEAIPEAFKERNTTLVVRTPAVPETHAELQFFHSAGFRIVKRAEVLGEISRELDALCVAGTHGKTTTSTLLAHLLRQSSLDCNAFLGGIALNYGTNLLLSEKSRLMVAEADEYDRSFHQLSPWMAAITSVDPDHLDIYHSHEAYLEAFAHFTSLIRPGGVLLMKQALVLQPILVEGVRQYTYATEQMPYGRSADFYAENIVIEEGRLYFDFNYPGGRIKKMELGLPIMIHVENALAAMGLAYLSGVSPGELRAALVSFKGNQRRFDFQIRRDDFVYIDDYAHHPDELKASIRSLKALYPGKELTGIFQPHLYSRTRDFAGEFAKALSGLDYVYLLDIYPAREEAIPRVDSRLIFDKLTSRGKILCSMDEILSLLDRKKPEVLVTLGAGNIDRLVPLLKEKYS